MAHTTGSVLAFNIRERVRMSLWFVPALAVTTAAGLAAALLTLDRRIPQSRSGWFLFGGGADSARTVLSVIAASMVTSISLVFSVTMVVLQLASAQYSPRVLRTFIRDRLVQSVLAIYIATFVYCLLVLPAVRSAQGEEGEYVPALTTTAGLGLALASLGLFVRYVHHIAHAIRAITILEAVGKETREALERIYPDQMGEEPRQTPDLPKGPPAWVVEWDGDPGVLLAVDEDAMIEAATEADAVVEVVPLVGAFVPTSAPVFRVWGELQDLSALTGFVTIDSERTMHQDPAFGFRQIVDIAERALSPGVNDPTTAVQAVDQLHDLLRRLVQRDLPAPHRVDGSGRLRVIAPRLGWDDYVALALDEIRQYGQTSVQVARRLGGVIDDLISVAPASRVGALERQRELLALSIDRGFPDSADRVRANTGSLIS